MNKIALNIEEESASSLLLKTYYQILDWGLNCNQGELTHAVHTIQMFIIKHMLQRLEAEDFSPWYDGK